MRVLLLSQLDWPEVRTAPTDLAVAARFLEERGHDVQVLTGFPCHPVGRACEGYRRPCPMDESQTPSKLRAYLARAKPVPRGTAGEPARATEA